MNSIFLNIKDILYYFLALFLIFSLNTVRAQEEYKLWESGEKPYYKENTLQEYQKEVWGTQCVFDITEPTLSIYKAKGVNTGKAIIIIPGGGYELVAMYHEGHEVAEKLAAQGITAGVLKYRLPNPVSSDQPHLVPLADTRKALQLIRSKSDQYGIDKRKVGVMGFSAGSHLATLVSLSHSDNMDENPNFSALIYGVTNLSEENLKWLEEKLYYRKLTAQEIKQNRLLDLVVASSPPAFLVHAYNDTVCRVEETTLYAQQLVKHNIPVETHLFTKGGHGFGLGKKEDGTDQWINLFINWLKNSDL